MNGITILVGLLTAVIIACVFLLVKYASAWAAEREREQRYADEWVKRQRAYEAQRIHHGKRDGA